MSDTKKSTEQERRTISSTKTEKYMRWFPIIVIFFGFITLSAGIPGFYIQYYEENNSGMLIEQINLPPGLEKVNENKNGPNKTSPHQSGGSYIFLKTIQLFLLNSGGEDDEQHSNNPCLTIARVFAALLFIFLSLTLLFKVSSEAYRYFRFSCLKDHVVICGLGRIGLEILDDYAKSKNLRIVGNKKRRTRVVVLETDANNPWIKYAKSIGAIVIVGDATRYDFLEHARVHKAESIIVASGNDGVNLEITAEIETLLNSKETKRATPLKIRTHIVDLNLSVTLQLLDRNQPSTETPTQFQKQIFNVAYMSATKVITEEIFPYTPQNQDEVAHFVLIGFGPMGQAMATRLAQLAHFQNCKRARMTICDVNINSVARDYLTRFPRFCSWTEKQVGVSQFNPEADSWNQDLESMPPQIHMEGTTTQYVCNTKFVELSPSLVGEQFVLDLKSEILQPNIKPIVFICGTDDRSSYETSLRLADLFDCHGMEKVPIFVWLPKQPALFTSLKSGQETLNKTKLIPFGDCKTIASYESIVNPVREKLGRSFNAAYNYMKDEAAFQRYLSENKLEVSSQEQRERYLKACLAKPQNLDEWTVKLWNTTSELNRESSRQVADHIPIKMETLNVILQGGASPTTEVKIIDVADLSSRIQEHQLTELLDPYFLKLIESITDLPWGIDIQSKPIERLFELEHNRWLAERLMAGTRYLSDDLKILYQNSKDQKRLRLHPNLVSWQSRFLRDPDKAKDKAQIIHLFRLYDLLLTTVDKPTA